MDVHKSLSKVSKEKVRKWFWRMLVINTIWVALLMLLFVICVVVYWIGSYQVNHHPITKEKVMTTIDASDILITASDTSEDSGWVIFSNNDADYNLSGRYQVFDSDWEAEMLYDEIFLEMRRLYDHNAILSYECSSIINGNLFEVTTSKTYSTCFQLDNKVFFITANVDVGTLSEQARNRVDTILETIEYPTKYRLRYHVIRVGDVSFKNIVNLMQHTNCMKNA